MIRIKKLVVFLCITNLFLINYTVAKGLKIGFFINYLSVRGVEVSTYDYADLNEKILGNESIILNHTQDSRHFNGKPLPDCPAAAREKFIKRFGDKFFDCTLQEMDDILIKEKVDILYIQKAGFIDHQISKVCKNAIHAVFTNLQVHGQAYACISEWLGNTAPHLNLPYVPYIVRLADTEETLHNELKIPHNAVVFGRHGGADTFDITFAKEAVIEVAQKQKEWYFIFLNTDKFCDLANVIFLPSTADMIYKTKFINTCDAMIHARIQGETFGLACAEFSIKNKPIITWLGSLERSHIDILNNKGLYYNNKEELLNQIFYCGKNINENRTKNWDAYSKLFSPELVMKKFDEVFIQPLNIAPIIKKPKIIGLIPARNESTFIEQCIKALSHYTDAIVYLDDASNDNSLEIVESISKQYHVKIIKKTEWYRDEPSDRNALLHAGRELGGTHFIVIDADEMLTANCMKDNFLKNKILALKPGDQLILNWIQLWRSLTKYRFDTSMWTWHYKDFIFCDDGKCFYSSEFIHTPRCPTNLSGTKHWIQGYTHGMLHFQFVNWRNLLIKQAWYRCLECIRQPEKSPMEINARYAPSKNESNLFLADSPTEWLEGYTFFDPSILEKSELWREKEVLNWFEQYSRDYFAQLDIWDIDWEK